MSAHLCTVPPRIQGFRENPISRGSGGGLIVPFGRSVQRTHCRRRRVPLDTAVVNLAIVLMPLRFGKQRDRPFLASAGRDPRTLPWSGIRHAVACGTTGDDHAPRCNDSICGLGTRKIATRLATSFSIITIVVVPLRAKLREGPCVSWSETVGLLKWHGRPGKVVHNLPKVSY